MAFLFGIHVDHIFNAALADFTELHMPGVHDTIDLRPVKPFGDITRSFKSSYLIPVFFSCKELIFLFHLPHKQRFHDIFRDFCRPEAVPLFLDLVAKLVKGFLIPGRWQRGPFFYKIFPFEIVLIE